MIYLATPYSDPDPQVRHDRFETACFLAGVLMEQGYIIFSPIAHCHPIAMKVKLPTDFEYWKKYCRGTLSVCKTLIVATMHGWGYSKGVAGEIAIANELSIPIRYFDPHSLTLNGVQL